MSDHPTPPRYYTEEEVNKILERATGLHGEGSGRSSGSLSLAELEDIALEVGIDPRELRRAAMELDSGELVPTGWARLLGGRLTLVREAIIPGEIPQAGFERVVTAIRQASGIVGEPTFLGRSLTWEAQTPGKLRSILLVAVAKDGETHIRIEERLDQLALTLFGGTLGGVGLGVGFGAGFPLAMALGSLLLGVPIVLGTVGLTHMATRPIYRAFVGKRRKAMDEMMEKVSWEVTQAIASASLQGAEESKQIRGS